MKEYNPRAIEKKWQDYWYSKKMFKAVDFDSTRKKYFALIEFPYPSGVGMHVGHVRAYSSLEVISRKRRMEGYNVLFPIGFDAFGLPTENYAIQTGIHPRKVTDDNIKTFTKQLKAAGFSFDFDRVLDTTDENYYKWTQWIFKKMYEHDLAYRDKTYVNFCPNCKVILANEESQGGKCDRCDHDVVQMEKDVWFLKITKYAERLLKGLNDVNYLPRMIAEQENWIGKSVGAHIDFKIKDSDEKLRVFTTRADTIYGVTFMVIAPEHDLINTLKDRITNLDEIKDYQEQAKKKSEFERLNLNKEKTGVLIKGIKAINPLSGKEIPIFIADYVLMGYGTGAIMAVPGHDERDYDFAKKFGLDIIEVISGGDISKEAYTDIENGTLVNSDLINGLSVKEAQDKIIAYLEENQIGEKAINYKMQDWAFNRQRYWGEPIPIVYCDECGVLTVNEEDLPVKLPYISHFQPSSTGESPLANIKEFVETTCPKCGKKARRETDTMPQWAGSSWYFLRYCDPHNDKEFASMDKLKYWMPVDWYNGGMEHVTRHLIYSRFYNHFLYDLGVVPTKEPYLKRTAQGLILGPDGEKMSKSKGNVVDPMTIIEEYGADTLRTYILFIGDYEQPTPWNDKGVKGCRRFLERVYKLFEKIVNEDAYTPEIENLIHITIKEVSNDIELTKFNTAISKLMILSNEMNKLDKITKKDYEVLIKLLNPFAPHMCEELNEMLGNEDSLVFASWPEYDEEKAQFDQVEIAVQVNGKLRGTFKIHKDASAKELEEAALEIESVQNHISGKTIRKIITVPNRIVNIVVS
jgi:leucyl-tRNA synthetase